MKKAMTFLLAGAILAPLAIGTTVQAAAGEDQPAVTSNGSVQFHKNLGPDEYELMITKVSDIDFGGVRILGDGMDANALYDETDLYTEHGGAAKVAPLNITTVDDRGTGAGWVISARMAKEFTRQGADESALVAGDVLGGATVTLSSQSALTSKAQQQRKAPTGFLPNVELALNDQFTPVMTAAETEGIGTWTTFFGELVDTATEGQRYDGVKLEVPGGLKIEMDEKYIADIEWQIRSTMD